MGWYDLHNTKTRYEWKWERKKTQCNDKGMGVNESNKSIKLQKHHGKQNMQGTKPWQPPQKNN